jgi:hypothetical protein
MDPFVTQLVMWIAQRMKPNRLVLSSLQKQAAEALDWPQPFAEAVVTATRARKLLNLEQPGSRSVYVAGLSERGKLWMKQHSGDLVATLNGDST